MPQKKSGKKPVKKVVAAKKAVKTAKKAAPAKKAAQKVSKPEAKSAKKGVAPKKAAKKAASRPIIKPVKTIKKTNHATVKPLQKHTAHPPEKHAQPMAKHKNEDKKPLTPITKPAKKQEPVKEVKLPKISAKSSVPYHPAYKSLEQRQEAVKPNELLVRYSDAELSEFRDLIQKKLDAAKKELAYLQGLITRKDDMGGDESENRYMTMEDGSISMEREQLSQMASRQITYIDHLEKALIRIENKTYGICRVTGKLIDKARLRAVPHATLSLEAKLGLVKAGE
jgi:RNA polymerase-binding transcription factor DksA